MIIKKIKLGFTLVELIVVITILAILWTIAFMSYKNYSGSAKDSVKAYNIKNISKTLELFSLDKWFFPKPDNSTTITYSWAKLWYQWEFWKNAFTNVWKLSDIPKSEWNNYTYSITSDKTQYQLSTIMNWPIWYNNIINNSYASNNKEAFAYVNWNYNWQFVKWSSGSTVYILATPSIITNSTGSKDLSSIITNKQLVFNWYKNLPLSYKNIWYNISWNFDYIPKTNILVFSWTLDELKNNVDKKLALYINLWKSYSWTILENNLLYKDLFNKNLNKSIVPINYITSILNNSFKLNSKLSINPIFEWFWVWFWGASSFPFTDLNNLPTGGIYMESKDLILNKNIKDNANYKWNIKNFNAANFTSLQNKLTKSKFVVYWVSSWWQESWFNLPNIQQLMDNWVVPVFAYWYFWDWLINNFPTSLEQNNYYTDASKFNTMLKKLNWDKLVLMEPEFNKWPIMYTDSNKHKFAKIISKAIDFIKKWNDNTYFSLTMIDKWSRKVYEPYCPNYINCSLWDQKVWKNVDIIYNDLKNKLDFISFQEMVAQFSRNPTNQWTWPKPIPISFSGWTTWISFLEKRIENMTDYLHKKYNKPVFLPYISIMTDRWVDSNSNNIIDSWEIINKWWISEAGDFYNRLSKTYKTLKSKWLFGYAVMELFDNPSKDAGWYKYFLNNEAKQWIVWSSTNWAKYPNWDIFFKWTWGLDIIDSIFNWLNY